MTGRIGVSPLLGRGDIIFLIKRRDAASPSQQSLFFPSQLSLNFNVFVQQGVLTFKQ
jgi:hypothetical protein